MELNETLISNKTIMLARGETGQNGERGATSGETGRKNGAYVLNIDLKLLIKLV